MGKDPLKIAQEELGRTESPAGSNKTPYGKWYGFWFTAYSVSLAYGASSSGGPQSAAP